MARKPLRQGAPDHLEDVLEEVSFPAGAVFHGDPCAVTLLLLVVERGLVCFSVPV